MIRTWFMTRQVAEIKEFKIPERFHFSNGGGFDPSFLLPVENMSFADIGRIGFSEISYRVFSSIAALTDDRFRKFWLT